MSKKLFVGNVEWGITDEKLKEMFSQFGEVEEAVVMKDRFSGKSRGFAFVTMKNAEDADKAVAELNGQDINGRKIAVNEATPQKDRPPRNRY